MSVWEGLFLLVTTIGVFLVRFDVWVLGGVVICVRFLILPCVVFCCFYCPFVDRRRMCCVSCYFHGAKYAFLGGIFLGILFPAP